MCVCLCGERERIRHIVCEDKVRGVEYAVSCDTCVVCGLWCCTEGGVVRKSHIDYANCMVSCIVQRRR